MLEFILHKYESIVEDMGSDANDDQKKSRGRRNVFEEKIHAAIEFEKKRIYTILRLLVLALVLFLIKDKWLIIASVVIYTVLFYRDAYINKDSKFDDGHFQKYKKACDDFNKFLIIEFSINEKNKMSSLISLCEDKIADLSFISDRNIGIAFVSISIIGSLIGYVADSKLTDAGGLSIMGAVYMILIVCSFVFGLGYLQHMVQKQADTYRYRTMLEVLKYLEKLIDV